MKSYVEQLKYMLKNDPSQKTKLTEHLDYSSTCVISNWVLRNSIPPYQLPRVKVYLQKWSAKHAKKTAIRRAAKDKPSRLNRRFSKK